MTFKRYAPLLGLFVAPAVLLIGSVFTAAPQTPPAAKVNDTISWDYRTLDQIDGAVTVFLVCLDGQATALCRTVPESSGVASTIVGMKTYGWTVPALTPGAHSVSVQACTAGAAACSSGVSFAFSVTLVIANPSNVRLTKGGTTP